MIYSNHQTTCFWCLTFLTSCLLLFLASTSRAGTYSGGTGTPDDPYQIATAEDLIALGKSTEDYDKIIVLTADVDLAGHVFDDAIIAPNLDEKSVSPLTRPDSIPFRGHFSGNGFVISNLTIDGTRNSGFGQTSKPQDLGLFGKVVEGAEISNLGVVDVHITNNQEASSTSGGIAGRNNKGTIINCFSSGKLYGRQYVGGIVSIGTTGVSTACSCTDPYARLDSRNCGP